MFRNSQIVWQALRKSRHMFMALKMLQFKGCVLSSIRAKAICLFGIDELLSLLLQYKPPLRRLKVMK